MAKSPITVELIRAQLGVESDYVEELYDGTIGTAVQQVVPNDPNRLGLTLVNFGTSSITLRFSNEVTSGKGIILASGGGNISFRYDLDFVLTVRSIYAVSASAGGSLYVLEVKGI